MDLGFAWDKHRPTPQGKKLQERRQPRHKAFDLSFDRLKCQTYPGEWGKLKQWDSIYAIYTIYAISAILSSPLNCLSYLVLRERKLQVLPWVETKLSYGPNLPEADRMREKGAQKALQLILANSKSSLGASEASLFCQKSPRITYCYLWLFNN